MNKNEKMNTDDFPNLLNEVNTIANKVEKNIDKTKGIIERSGWFYDDQKTNYLTSIRLFANKECKTDENGNITWTDYDDYLVNLISCNAVINEDFNIQLNNTWTDVGEDLVGGAVNSVLKDIAPYAKLLQTGVDNLLERHLEIQDGKNEELLKKINDSTVATKLYQGVNLLEKAKSWFGKHNIDSKIFNTRLITQGAQFTYYGGSSVEFSNLSLKFTIFPKFGRNSYANGITIVNNTETYFENNYEEFVTVVDQIEELYPYFLGEIVEINNKDGAIESFLQGTKLEYFINTEEVREHFKLQRPPLQYESINRDKDYYKIPGTLMINIGDCYRIKGLVITNVNLTFSKQMVKNPIETDNKNQLSPLYCDVVINLRPATKYTDRSLKNFIKKFSSDDKIVQSINNNLKEIKDSLDNQYN